MERLRDHPLRAERVMHAPPKTGAAGLPSHTQVLAELEAAEHSEGWLRRCVEARRYLTLSAPLVHALAETIRGLDEGPIVEVGAGDGSLAAALGRYGLSVIATDADPPSCTEVPVERLAGDLALRTFLPRVVLGSFVPVDSGVDRQVLASPEVRHYLVLNARIGGEFGAWCLWTHPGWTRRPLPEVTRWMLCRHDVWSGGETTLLHHGEAWLLSRTGEAMDRIS